MNEENTSASQGFFVLPQPPKLSGDAYLGAQRSSSMARAKKRKGAVTGGQDASAAAQFASALGRKG